MARDGTIADIGITVGRIGDSPSFGSGFYCSTWPSSSSQKLKPWQRLLQHWRGGSSQMENGVAISGTGDGDYFLRNCAAYDVVARMQYLGQTVKDASKEVVENLRDQGGIGGLIAVDLQGNCEHISRSSQYV
jgi:beta-aspartyl-peptidase (threonine type)